MPRPLSLLPAALFLSGIVAGRLWTDRPSGGEFLPPAAATAKEVSESRETGTRVEGERLADEVADATLEEVMVMWNSLETGGVGKSGGGKRDPHTEPWRRILMLERWAELDPPGALAAVRRLGADGHWLLRAVFRSWALRDPAAAMNALKAEPGETQAAAAAGWLSAWADEPALFARRAAELKWIDVSRLGDQFLRNVVSIDDLVKIYAADREGLLALSDWLRPWYEGLLRGLDWRDALSKGGEEARAAADFLPATNDDIRRMAPDLTSLFRSRPGEAMDLLERLPARGSSPDWAAVRRGVLSDAFLAHWMVGTIGASDPDRLMKVMSAGEPGGAVSFALHSALMESLARTDPAAALRLAGRLTWGTDIAYAALHWPPPRLEPAAALAAARDAPPSWLRDWWLDRALPEMPRAEAAAWVEALPEGELRSSAQITLDTSDLPAGERALRRLVSQFPGETLDAPARERISAGGEQAFQGADLSAMAGRITAWPEGAARNGAVENMAMRWPSIDTPQALAWTASLTDESLRAASSAGIAKAWAGADPAAASEWVDSLPPGPAREAAAGELAAGIAGLDPESAARWAASLADPRARGARLSEVAAKWAVNDAAAAAASIRALPGLTDAERAALLRSLPPKP